MANIIDKHITTLDEALNSKSLKKKTNDELERILQTLLCDVSDNDVSVNIIIGELLKRGVSKEEIGEKSKQENKDKVEKAFKSLGLDIIEKADNNKKDLIKNIINH